jgi:hypothetical protein
MAYRLRDVLLTVGSTLLFKILFCLQHHYLVYLPIAPSHQESTLLADRGGGRGAKSYGRNKAYVNLRRGGQMLL